MRWQVVRNPLLVIVVVLTTISGCAHCRLPAIDPSGERIFRGSTGLASCSDCPLIPKCPVPAWTTPAVPPACPAGAPTGPLAAAAAGNLIPVAPTAIPNGFQLDQEPASPTVRLSPTQFVAPVGSDVVLVAGLCGTQGRYITKQPIEWIVAPEGVGHILEIGRESCYLSPCKTVAHKVNATFATAHTSTISQTVTRGTQKCEDDVHLKKGESWISVTSPAEGTTYVTAYAPRENNWDRRKQTARIYWVDAKWTFPQPVIVRPSEKHLLKTSVVRTNGQPVSNWLVRYDILEGPPVGFGAAGEKSIEVATDARGEGNVELLPQSREAGISQIRVQIFRPNPARPDETPMLVGQGYTHIQWSTPGLLVRGSATQETREDGIINYQLEVVNNGDQMSRDVTLSFSPPAGVAVQASNPQAQAFGPRLEWRLGNLAAQSTRVVTITARANLGGDVRSCFVARSAEGLETPPTCFNTRTTSTALQVRVRGPANTNVNVGDQIKYEIQITNSSNVPITGVVIRDTFDAGLEQKDGEPSPIERVVGKLEPGQATPANFGVTFNVTRPGDLSHRIEVFSDAGPAAASTHNLRAVQPATGALKVDIKGSVEQAREGEKVIYSAVAANTGSVSLSNVRLEIAPGDTLRIGNASEAAQQGQGSVFWVYARLDPGQTARAQLECTCLRAGEARVAVGASADGVQVQTLQTATRILPGTQPMIPERGVPERIPMNPAGVGPRAVGALRVSLASTANPIPVGKETSFIVSIRNDSSLADENIVVHATFPEGLTFQKALEGPVGISRSGKNPANAFQIEMSPVRQVRMDEQLPPFKFLVKGVRPGKYVVKLQVFSAAHPDGLTREETIEVFGAGN